MTQKGRLSIFAVGILLVIISVILPLPNSILISGKIIVLAQKGKVCLGILAMVILFWMTEIMPFAVSGLLAIVLMHVLRVEDFKALLANGFGHPVAAFVLGVLLLSLAVTKTGLGARVTYLILSRFGVNPKSILFGFLLTGALISMWMSETAVAAILMPIAVSIVRAQGLKPLESNFARALLIACVWGPSVGGIATPAGAAPHPVVLSFLRDMGGVDKGFVDWMILGIPTVLLLLPLSWFILVKMFPPEMQKLTLRRDAERDVQSRGRWLSQKEVVTLIVFCLTVGVWIFGDRVKSVLGVDLSMEYVVAATSMLLFFPGLDVLSWPEVQREFSWGAWLTVMEGLTIGFAVHSSGAMEWLSCALLVRFGGMSLFSMIIVATVSVSLLHNVLSSNTVTAVVMTPILIYLAKGMGLPLWVSVGAPSGFASTLGLIMVTTTPTNLIPYSAGYFSIKDFAKAGVFMSVLGSIVVGCVIYVMHVLIGV